MVIIGGRHGARQSSSEGLHLIHEHATERELTTMKWASETKYLRICICIYGHHSHSNHYRWALPTFFFFLFLVPETTNKRFYKYDCGAPPQIDGWSWQCYVHDAGFSVMKDTRVNTAIKSSVVWESHWGLVCGRGLPAWNPWEVTEWSCRSESWVVLRDLLLNVEVARNMGYRTRKAAHREEPAQEQQWAKLQRGSHLSPLTSDMSYTVF